jgi:hypothetical protein
MADQCKWGHPTPLRSDRDASGFCRACKRVVNQRARDRRKQLEVANRAALDTVLAFQQAGVRFVNEGEPVTAEQVAEQLVRLYAQHT